ncbi:MAG: MBOAT family protein [Crocinitomicaceae bacterium]
MIFSSTLFVFLFLPAFLAFHFLIPKKHRNLFILLASLFFYAWGEHILVLLMMGSICVNYVFGNLISTYLNRGHEKHSKIFLILGIVINLSVLAYYKYIHFFIESLKQTGIELDIDMSEVTLPIGISFFTFQSISYLIDVYRRTVTGQKNLINLGMYIALFPQLIAGPIVRYADISKEIVKREISLVLFKTGISRFIVGFAKKVLLANNVGLIADKVFAIAPDDLSTPLAWIGIVCYSLQIYYDFSGYSDMAIGLGKMLGFNFKENFEHPYISKSIREFWRRWHISLSSWFKDYLYIPLGGNKKGKFRTYFNLLIVFFLTGLWHGASWSFVIWGLFHGFFIVIERLGIIKFQGKLNILSRVYLLLVVIIGWVFFRVSSLEDALRFISKMFSFSSGTDNYPYLFINNYILTIIVVSITFTMPVKKILSQHFKRIISNEMILNSVKHSFLICIFILSIMELAQTTYNPFIYYRF